MNRETYQHALFNTIALVAVRTKSFPIPSFILEIHIQVEGDNCNQLHRIPNQHTEQQLALIPPHNHSEWKLTQYKHYDILVPHYS